MAEGVSDGIKGGWMMSEEIYRQFKELRQERHRQWREINTNILDVCGIPYRKADVFGNCYLIREEGKPKVDFYPSTGRWVSGGQTFSGGASKFIKWYGDQVALSEEYTTRPSSEMEMEHSTYFSRQ
jgi:hypothetical protein